MNNGTIHIKNNRDDNNNNSSNHNNNFCSTGKQMEELRNELNQIIEVAGNINGVHKRVAKKIGKTTVFIGNIRRGEVLNNNKENSIETIKALIEAYRKELREYAKEIEVVL